MQRKVTGGSVSFNQTWAEYRDGFGAATDNDNYWLGLEKIYRLLQFGNLRLRIEAKLHLLTAKFHYTIQLASWSEAGSNQLANCIA